MGFAGHRGLIFVMGPPQQHAKAETPMPSSSTPSSPHTWARPTSLQAMLLLGGLGTLNILWSDMLFPAITSIQQELGTSATAVQQTVSLFFVANAFMCRWHGVLSDAWGRRKPLFIGLVVLVLTSLLSLLATRIEHLWILRTVQGLVVGLGHILCRAVIRDLYSGVAAQKMIANTTLVQSAGTIVLPMLGLADVDVGLACGVCVSQRNGRPAAACLRAQAA